MVRPAPVPPPAAELRSGSGPPVAVSVPAPAGPRRRTRTQGQVAATSNGLDGLLVRLGTPGGEHGESSRAAGGDQAAAEEPAVEPQPLEDYSWLRIAYPDAAIDALALATCY